MKKKIIAGLLSLGAASALASDYLDIAYLVDPTGHPPGAYVGTTTNGITLLGVQAYNGVSSKLIDTRRKITQEEVIENSDAVLPALPWPNGYESGLLANYPSLPINVERFQHLGIAPDMSEGEFQEVVKPLIKMIESYLVGNEYIYDAPETQGYRAVGVGGNWVAFTDGPKESAANIYSCDISEWDFSDTFQKNLDGCTSTDFYSSGKASFSFEYPRESMNSKGTHVIKANTVSGDRFSEVKVFNTQKKIYEKYDIGQSFSYNNSKISLSDGENQFFVISGGERSSNLVRWIGDGVYPVEVLNDEIVNGIINVEDEYINYSLEGNLYTCENNIQDSDDLTYRDYVNLKISRDNPLYEFYYSYPSLPDNLDSLIVLGKFEDLIPIGSGIEEYRNFVETYLLPEANADIQKYQDTKTKLISCVEESETLIANGFAEVAETMVLDGSLRTLYSKNIKSGDTNFTVPNSLVSLTYDHESKITSSISKEILTLMEGSDYRSLIDISRIENSKEFGELFKKFPNLDGNHEEYGLKPDTSKEEYIGYVANILINNIPFNKSSDSFPFRLPYAFHYNNGQLGFNAGLINFNGGSYRDVSVAVNPKFLLIDPYTNPASSFDIVTDGELFAADVSCAVAGPMDITSADYGNWGGSERLTLPLQWASKNAKGVVSLKGDVNSVSGEQQLLVLDTLAEVTTADVTINCSATVSDKNGNQLNVNLVPATIRLDDGIHGGSSVISGQVTLPAGVSSENVTVEITINGRTIRLNVDENGRFEFDELRDGDFTINVKSERYTQSCINTQTTGTQIDLGIIELIAGDVNNDGEINIADFTYLAGRYGSAKGDNRYTAQADLNSDEKVNIQDLAILGSHFGSRQCSP